LTAGGPGRNASCHGSPEGESLKSEVESMGKTFLAAGLLLWAGVAQAQELKKGNLVGTHSVIVKLEPGVTMERLSDFYKKRFIPEYEKSHPGWKVYPVKRIRGEKADGMGLIIVVPSEAERDKYYNPDGSDTALGKAASAKLDPVAAEMTKLATVTADRYTDWLVY
jgi:hypothetical protein